jgi:hypothetical protein
MSRNERTGKEPVKVVVYRTRDGREAMTAVTPKEYGALRKAGRIVKDCGGWK